MSYIGMFLIAFFPTVIKGGVLQEKVIQSFLEDLAEKDITDPTVIPVIDIILDKLDGPNQCLRVINLTCTARLETPGSSAERISREVPSTKTFLREFISNLAKNHYPKMLTMVKNVLSNRTTDNFNDKFSKSADLILLKSVANVNKALDSLMQYRAPLITVSSLILMLTLILILACMTSACQEMRAKRKARKAEKLENYWRRRSEAHELS